MVFRAEIEPGHEQRGFSSCSKVIVIKTEFKRNRNKDSGGDMFERNYIRAREQRRMSIGDAKIKIVLAAGGSTHPRYCGSFA